MYNIPLPPQNLQLYVAKGVIELSITMRYEKGAWVTNLDICATSVHEIAAGHRSLSGTISCVIDRIRFLPVSMTGRFSNFSSTSYTKDRHESQVADTKCRLPDTMSSFGEIFISGATVRLSLQQQNFLRITKKRKSCEIIKNSGLMWG